MIDWTSVIIAMLTGGTLAGAATSIMFWRENKRIKKSEAQTSEALAKKEGASAIKEDASAAKELLDVLRGTKEHMESMNQYNEKATTALLKSLDEKDAVVEELKKEMQELKLEIAEHKRKIKGLENTLNEERSARKELEQYKCIVEGCSMRRPPLKNESA